jgi:hypothetical protein
MLSDREHESLVRLPRTTGDARRSRRRPFSNAHLVAIWKSDDGLPLVLREQLECRDLSTTGIGFFWYARPEFSSVLLGLGAETVIYVKARMVRWNQGYWNGRRCYLVGCEFSERVEPATVQKWIDAAGEALIESL